MPQKKTIASSVKAENVISYGHMPQEKKRFGYFIASDKVTSLSGFGAQ